MLRMQSRTAVETYTLLFPRFLPFSIIDSVSIRSLFPLSSFRSGFPMSWQSSAPNAKFASPFSNEDTTAVSVGECFAETAVQRKQCVLPSSFSLESFALWLQALATGL